MINVVIEIKNVDKVIDFLKFIKQEVDRNDVRMKKVGEYLKDFFSNEMFDSEGATIGEPWAPLTASTQREKSKTYPGRGILERSGAMRKGFRFRSSTNNLRLYNVMEYLKFHQGGTSKMPQRIVMALDNERIGQVSGIIVKELFKNIQSKQ